MRLVIERSAYRGPELRQLLAEHGLTKAELACIMQTDRRDVYRYLKDERRVLNVRWRLLMLELGLQRPAFTSKKRLARMMAEYIGDDAYRPTARQRSRNRSMRRALAERARRIAEILEGTYDGELDP